MRTTYWLPALLLALTLLTLATVPVEWRGPVAVIMVLGSLGMMRLAAAR